MRVWSIACAAVLAVACLTTMLFVGSAAEPAGTLTAQSEFACRVTTDDATNTVPSDFGTAAADGRVWVDKSVTADEAGNAFNVALSGLAQEYTYSSDTIEEIMEQNAADVLFVLDFSSSMGGTMDSSTRMEVLASSMNSAMKTIMEVNPYNRVMAVIFDKSAGDFLPLASYSAGTDGNFVEYDSSTKGIKTASGVKVNGADVSYSHKQGSGTHMQIGITYGCNQLLQSMTSGYGDGRRLPFVMVMTDGASNYSNTNFAGVNLSSNSTTSTQIEANSTLAASYWKKRLIDAYTQRNTANGFTDEINAVWFNIGMGISEPSSMDGASANQTSLSPAYACPGASSTSNAGKIYANILTRLEDAYLNPGNYVSNTLEGNEDIYAALGFDVAGYSAAIAQAKADALASVASQVATETAAAADSAEAKIREKAERSSYSSDDKYYEGIEKNFGVKKSSYVKGKTFDETKYNAAVATAVESAVATARAQAIESKRAEIEDPVVEAAVNAVMATYGGSVSGTAVTDYFNSFIRDYLGYEGADTAARKAAYDKIYTDGGTQGHVFAEYVNYADTATKVSNSFTDLANLISASTQATVIPITKKNTSDAQDNEIFITFNDPIGNGAVVKKGTDGNYLVSVTLEGVTYTGRPKTGTGVAANTYEFYKDDTVLQSTAVVTDTNVQWSVNAYELPIIRFKNRIAPVSGEYEDPNLAPIVMNYTVTPTVEGLANTSSSNAFIYQHDNIISAPATAVFTPDKKNTFYYTISGSGDSVTSTAKPAQSPIVKATNANKTETAANASTFSWGTGDNAVEYTVTLGNNGRTKVLAEVSITPDKTKFEIDEQVTYTMTVKNRSDEALTNMVFTSTVDSDMEYVSTDTSYASKSGNVISWNIDSLASGATKTVKMTTKPGTGAVDGTVADADITLTKVFNTLLATQAVDETTGTVVAEKATVITRLSDTATDLTGISGAPTTLYIKETGGSYIALTKTATGTYAVENIPLATYTIYGGNTGTPASYGTVEVVEDGTNTAYIDWYKVTFDEDGGTDVSDQVVLKGNKATEPTTTKTGYDFLGWYKGSSDTAFDFTTAITADTALTAKWKIQTKDITFKENGKDEDKNNVPDESKTTVNYGEKIQIDPNGGTYESSTAVVTKTITADLTISDPTRTGYVFTGWKKTAGTGDIKWVYTAQWEEDKIGGGTDLDESDGIPDKYQKPVTFKIVNGKWSDATDTAKKYVLTLLDDDGLYAADGKATVTVPTGMTAKTGYDLAKGAWDVTPTASQQYTTPVTYTYTLPKLQYTVTVTVGANGSASQGTKTVEYGDDFSTVFTPSTGYVIDTVKVDGAYVVRRTDKTYGFEDITADHTIEVTFAEDKIGGGDDLDEEDGVPDKYQAIVTYKVVNGTWDGTKTANIKKLFAMAENTTGEWVALNPKLGATVPTGMQPDDMHVSTGAAWDKTCNATVAVVDGDVFTYTFGTVKTHTITSVVENGTDDLTSGTVTHHDDKTITFTPTSGYALDMVEVDGAVAVLTDSKYTFSDVTADHTIKVVYAKDDNNDNIPDKYQATVTYKVVNGTWDGTKTADISKLFNMKEYVAGVWNDLNPKLGDTVPTGMQPDDMHVSTGAAWDKTCNATVAVVDGDVFTYTFNTIKTHVITSVVENGTDDLVGGTMTVNHKSSGNTITFTANEGYALDSVEVDGAVAVLTDSKYTFDNVTEDHNIKVVYAKDDNKDGIPDKYQATVTYKVVNGTWDGTKTADISKLFTLKEYVGGVWNDLNPTLGDTVPKGMQPDDMHTVDDAAWDKVCNSTVAVTADAVYTYKFGADKTHEIISVVENGTDDLTDGTVLHLDDKTITYTANEGYALDSVTVDGNITVLTDGKYTFKEVNADHEIKVVYATDDNNDGIPDKYQATVTYKVVNGTWNGEESEPIDALFNMKAYVMGAIVGPMPLPGPVPMADAGDVPGTWIDLNPTLGDTVPEGMVPDDMHVEEGASWDKECNASVPVVDGDVFTYTFGTIKTHEITSIVENGKDDLTDGKATVVHLDDKTITYTPNEGYALDIVKVDGKIVELTDGKYTFTDVDKDHEIVVTFSTDDNKDGIPDKYQATVTYKVVNGTWSDETADPIDKLFNMQEYVAGEWKDLNPTLGDTVPTGMVPDDMHVDTDGAWDKTCDASVAVVDKDVFTFTFGVIKTHKITVEVEGGTSSVGDKVTVTHKDDQTITFTPDEHKVILSVVIDDKEEKINDDLTYKFEDVTEDHKIVVVFADDKNDNGVPDIFEVKVTYQVENGTWSDGKAEDIVAEFALKELKDGAWTDKNPTLGDTIPTGMKPDEMHVEGGSWNTAIAADTAVTANATYRYTFGEEKVHTITVEIENGTTDPNQGSFPVKHKDDQDIKITPNKGYVIDKVIVDGEEQEIPKDGVLVFTEILTDHDVKIICEEDANGDQIADKYQAMVEIDIDTQQGEASGDGVYWIGETATVTVTPKTGYDFIGWFLDGELVSSDPTYTFTANANVKLTALFETAEEPTAAPTTTTAAPTTTAPAEAPKTGEAASVCSLLAAASAAIGVLLLARKRKEEE